MKKIIILCLTFISISLSSIAQVDSTSQSLNLNGPIITFDTLVVDFGVIEQNSEPFRSLSFTNTGNKPLFITKCQGSCGCTIPDCPESSIMPGEKSELKVRYATDRVGRISKSFTVKSNAANGTITIRVVGTVNAIENPS